MLGFDLIQLSKWDLGLMIILVGKGVPDNKEQQYILNKHSLYVDQYS